MSKKGQKEIVKDFDNGRFGNFEPSPDLVNIQIYRQLKKLLAEGGALYLDKLNHDEPMEATQALPINLEGFTESEREAFRQKVYRVGEAVLRDQLGPEYQPFTVSTQFRGNELLVWFVTPTPTGEQTEEMYLESRELEDNAMVEALGIGADEFESLSVIDQGKILDAKQHELEKALGTIDESQDTTELREAISNIDYLRRDRFELESE